IIPLQPELGLIVLRALTVINTVDVEFPVPSAPNSGLQRYALADLPVKSLRRTSADDGPLAVFQEVVPFFIGDHQLGKHLPLIFRINDELWKEILFVLIDTTEPIVVSNDFDPGD